MIANIITISRVVFSTMLLFFVKDSNLFILFYVLCGVSDIFDGFIARVLHTESEIGATFDSIADLVFVIVYIVKILPSLFLLSYEYIWISIIAIIKIVVILLRSIKIHKFYIEHSILNKLTGLLMFILPLSVKLINIRYSITIVCILATITIIDEIHKGVKC